MVKTIYMDDAQMKINLSFIVLYCESYFRGGLPARLEAKHSQDTKTAG